MSPTQNPIKWNPTKVRCQLHLNLKIFMQPNGPNLNLEFPLFSVSEYLVKMDWPMIMIQIIQYSHIISKP